MSKCCGKDNPEVNPTDPCASMEPICCSSAGGGAILDSGPMAWFGNMIGNCLDYARTEKAKGRPIVGIMCEYTPRELIMAAGGVPVSLCGGSEATVSAAEEHLPANLCPLIKSTYGYHLKKSNPFLEMADLIVAETTCDGKKKMFELMAEERPMFVLELPQKSNDADAFGHWLGEMEKMKAELERRFGVRISPSDLRNAIGIMNRERQLRRRLANLMRVDVPPLTGLELLGLKSSISGIPADLDQYEKILEMLEKRTPSACARKRVRVLMTGVPMAHGAERVLEIIEGAGGLVVAMENCTGLKPIMEDVDAEADDLMRALAEKYYHLPCSVMTLNDARMELISQLAKEYRAECVIDLVWQACLTYDVESARVRQITQERLGLPYLRIETDYSPSDSARIAVRVEALFEMTGERSC